MIPTRLSDRCSTSCRCSRTPTGWYGTSGRGTTRYREYRGVWASGCSRWPGDEPGAYPVAPVGGDDPTGPRSPPNGSRVPRSEGRRRGTGRSARRFDGSAPGSLLPWRTVRWGCNRAPPAAACRRRTRHRMRFPGSGSSTRCRRRRPLCRSGARWTHRADAAAHRSTTPRSPLPRPPHRPRRSVARDRTVRPPKGLRRIRRTDPPFRCTARYRLDAVGARARRHTCVAARRHPTSAPRPPGRR